MHQWTSQPWKLLIIKIFLLFNLKILWSRGIFLANGHPLACILPAYQLLSTDIWIVSWIMHLDSWCRRPHNWSLLLPAIVTSAIFPIPPHFARILQSNRVDRFRNRKGFFVSWSQWSGNNLNSCDFLKVRQPSYCLSLEEKFSSAKLKITQFSINIKERIDYWLKICSIIVVKVF